MQEVVQIFYSWRKYLTKENLIRASLEISLDEAFEPRTNNDNKFKNFDRDIAKYVNGIKAFPNSNLTLLDVWSYSSGVFDDNGTHFQNFLDSIPLKVMRNCNLYQSENDCLLFKAYSKEVEKHQEIFEKISQSGHDLVPLCSYATKKKTLMKCNTFDYMKTRLDNEDCYTFNESIEPTLGPTQGLNFLVNYDYPGTFKELNKPVTISLHEPGKHPDTQNIKGKNYYIYPGNLISLGVSATVINTTNNFDDLLDLETKDCESQRGYDDIGCIQNQVSLEAFKRSGCYPWYVKYLSNTTCNINGILQYRDGIRNGLEDKAVRKRCYHACKRIKYSLQLAEKKPIEETLLDIDSYGEEFKGYYQNPDNLYGYLGSFDTLDDFLKAKMSKTSLVHINFEESEVLSLTKDVKVTFADMVGNIGGTLGVFIGFSFLGLLDSLIELFQYLHTRLQNIAP